MLRRLLTILPVLLAAAWPAHADEAFDAVAQARRQCAANAPALRPDAQLHDAAARLARGARLPDAVKASGYRAQRSSEWQLSGYASPQAVASALARQHCSQLGRPDLADAAVYRQGSSWWIIAAAPFAPPAATQAGDVAARVLALVNEARSQPRRCGDRGFGAAAPLQLDAALMRAAAVHAQAMARDGDLDHRGSDGSTPSERAGKAGYDWRSIGENIAAGQLTPERVVQDWMASPEHCANLMDAGFTQMGVAFAVNKASDGGIYWAQEFGRPRAASR